MDFIYKYILNPPIEAHAELPFVEDAADFVGSLIPDLSGDPMTWGPNFVNWNLQNYVRILDNVFGYHNYDQNTEFNFSTTFYTAEAEYNYVFAGNTTTYTGIIYGIPSTENTSPVTIFNGPHLRVDIISDSSTPFTVNAGFITSGSYQGPSISGSGVAYPIIMVDEDWTQTIGTAVFRSSGSIPSYTAFTKPNVSTSIARLKSVGVTSNQAVLASHPEAAFIRPGTYNYDGFKKQIINNFNETHPEATVNPDDFPSWQEVLDEVHPEDATEPTEPVPGGPGLTKEELYEVLTTEDYDMDQLHTNPTYDDENETVYILESMPDFYSSDFEDFLHGDLDMGLGPDYDDLEISYVMGQTLGGLEFWTDSAVHLLSGSILGLVIVIVVINFILDKFSD